MEKKHIIEDLEHIIRSIDKAMSRIDAGQATSAKFGLGYALANAKALRKEIEESEK